MVIVKNFEFCMYNYSLFRKGQKASEAAFVLPFHISCFFHAPLALSIFLSKFYTYPVVLLLPIHIPSGGSWRHPMNARFRCGLSLAWFHSLVYGFS